MEGCCAVRMPSVGLTKCATLLDGRDEIGGVTDAEDICPVNKPEVVVLVDGAGSGGPWSLFGLTSRYAAKT
jgi:hypothetical protein